MKKSLIIFLLAVFVLSGAFLLDLVRTEASSDVSAGSVIKGEGNPTLYYLGDDGKRYVFPNDKTYFSWYDDFEEVMEIPLEDLYEYPLGGNVRYKPGAMLVKIQTDPKVYAVGENGRLRWIKSEALAKRLYGNYWNKLVDDVPDSFFTNYAIGEAVEDEEDYLPEEEEANAESISYNLKLKTKNRIQNRIKNQAQLRCERLENAINRLQKRAQLWGLELPDLGSDYVDECMASAAAKVKVCKIDAAGNAHTLEIARPAVLAHLKAGATLGECEDDSSSSDSEDGDDSSDDSDSGDNVDTTAPSFLNIVSTTTQETATVSFETDEAAATKIFYLPNGASEEQETKVSDSATTSHLVILSDLASSTLYSFYLEAQDEAGNIATTTSQEFETL